LQKPEEELVPFETSR